MGKMDYIKIINEIIKEGEKILLLINAITSIVVWQAAYDLHAMYCTWKNRIISILQIHFDEVNKEEYTKRLPDYYQTN